MVELMTVREAGPNVERPEERSLRRPGRGSGRASGPSFRPSSVLPPPIGRPPTTPARSCVVSMPETRELRASVPVSAWRLTERGVAVVLVTGLMIMVAALTVVGLTAVKVTGAGYQPSVSASLPR